MLFPDRKLVFALILLAIASLNRGEAQSAGGIAIATSNIRYSPVAFPQLLQLNNFGTITISLTAADSAGMPLTFNLTSVPSIGSVGPLNPATGQIEYTPLPGTTSPDTFTFSVSDGVLSSTPATVIIFPPLPVATLSAMSFDMGLQLKGLKGPAKALTVSNPSPSPLNISSIVLNGPDSADFAIDSTGTCPINGVLPNSATCTVVLSFSPSVVGTRSATLAITDDALDSPQTLVLTGTGTDLSLGAAASGSTSATVAAGQTATYNLEVDSVNGFTGLVSLSCAGAPARATCSVSPSQLSVTGAATVFNVSVATTASTTAQTPASPFSGKPPYLAAWALFAFTLIALLRLPGLSNRRRPAFLGAGILGLALLVVSCGGNTNSSPPPVTQPGTPAGTYTLTVTGVINGATRSTPLTLVVH